MDINSIREKEKMLSIVAYGCHQKIHKRIIELLEEQHKLKTFFFYEYFFTTPLFKNAARNKIRMFAPFLERVLNKMDFVPKNIKYEEVVKYNQINLNAIKFTHKSDKAKKDFWKEKVVVTDFINSAGIGSELYNGWEAEQPIKILEPIELNIKYDKKSSIESGYSHIDIEYLRERYLIDISNKEDDKDALMKEFILISLPWLRDPELKSLNVYCASISSKNIFYGYILLFYPDLEDNNLDNKLDKEITDYLTDYIEKTYAPLLALFENYWEEKMLREDIKNHSAIEPEKYIFLSENLKDSNDIIEQALYTLWRARVEALHNGQEGKVKESLIFAEYLIGSPGMVEQIKAVMGLNLKYKQGSSLPAVLVVGGPGSGKNEMSKVIKLFSENYSFGKEYIINMAMLRPKEITVPLLMGTDLTYCFKDETKPEPQFLNLLLDGIFKKANDENKKKGNGYKPSFIFDELNSLDIESQGCLLRMIENAKIIPLGGLKEEEVNFLVIGVMNEDPESLTMQRPLEEILKRERIFGGILGDILYEYFRGMRRLRDDLYYRIIRDGKIAIPELKERREDIPIMFYFFVSNLMDNENKFDIDIEVYEELMDDTYKWPGNFRQLQAIAKETVREASKDIARQKGEKELRICGIHVKKAIEKDRSLSKYDKIEKMKFART